MLYFLLAAIGVVLLLPTGTKKTGEETEQPQETAACILKRGSGFASPFFAIKNVDVLSNDAKNKKNNAGGDIISYRCNIWIKYK